jgi:SEC-C motif-containing protein
MQNNKLSKCHSGKLYKDCCEKYHDGELPENALALMRSRYSAYANGKVDYIISTTHVKNSNFTKDLKKWSAEIKEFCEKTKFEGLDILEFIDNEPTSYVTFRVHLLQGNRDASFTERSKFLKTAGKWYYLDGFKAS